MAKHDVAGQPRIPKGGGDHAGEWTKGGAPTAAWKAKQKAKAATAASEARKAKAKAGHKPVDEAKQGLAFQGEQLVIEKWLGLTMTPNAFPVDGYYQQGGKWYGVEVKSVIDADEEKVNMKQESIARKLLWYAQMNGDKKLAARAKAYIALSKKNKKIKDPNKRTKNPPLLINNDHPYLHTISPDYRKGPPPTIYYRRGVGAYVHGTMIKVRNPAHLRKLMGYKP